MIETQTNLLEYIGAEETNLLVSMMRFPRDINAFQNIDGLFQAPTTHIDIKVKDFEAFTDDERHKITVVALYSFVHFHLYFSTTCLLRCHLSDSLASTRKAIDAALTAYKLIHEPKTLNEYVEGHYAYKFIKKHIDKARQKDKTLYPVAQPLIELHEICSEFGSHADVGSFIHRVRVEKTSGVNKQLLKHLMFQVPEHALEHRYYLLRTYLGFVLMVLIFTDFIGGLTKGFDVSDWKKRVEEMGGSVQSVADECMTAMRKEGLVSE
jgi:hypothetical protein